MKIWIIAILLLALLLLTGCIEETKFADDKERYVDSPWSTFGKSNCVPATEYNIDCTRLCVKRVPAVCRNIQS